jgi:two-component system OmpR family response regulator
MKTVLLVEDDFDNATLVEDIFAFEDLDAELVITQTGEDALRLAAELQPELILMDLQLPGIGGGWTQHARSSGNAPRPRSPSGRSRPSR